MKMLVAVVILSVWLAATGGITNVDVQVPQSDPVTIETVTSVDIDNRIATTVIPEIDAMHAKLSMMDAREKTVISDVQGVSQRVEKLELSRQSMATDVDVSVLTNEINKLTMRVEQVDNKPRWLLVLIYVVGLIGGWIAFVYSMVRLVRWLIKNSKRW